MKLKTERQERAEEYLKSPKHVWKSSIVFLSDFWSNSLLKAPFIQVHPNGSHETS